jgi:hypothetical protein
LSLRPVTRSAPGALCGLRRRKASASIATSR